MRTQVRLAKQQLRDIEQALIQEPQLQQQRRQLEDRMARLRTTVLTEDELPTMIEQLTDLAGQTGVKIQLISPQRAFPASLSPDAYKEIPIQIEALAGFHQLGTFLSRVELGTQPMQVRTLRISENPKLLRRHLVKLTLLAYAMSSALKPALSQRPTDTAGGS
ncbi:MAG: type 4a pilus biogenesis protein PilO [Candidatus Omnitrophica bacterium]|nr:type 4a pilus biogenesis protein PilO [Candidatus Omnitrophota bacterium]